MTLFQKVFTNSFTAVSVSGFISDKLCSQLAALAELFVLSLYVC